MVWVQKKIAGNFCILSSETTGQTITLKIEEVPAAAASPAAVKGEWKVRGTNGQCGPSWAIRGPDITPRLSCVLQCPMGDRHIHGDDVTKV